jgi:biopolymer transport protein ExbD
MSQLPLRLSSIKASKPDPKFTLNADSRANFDKVVVVLDEIRKLGVTKIGISTKTRQ